MSTIYTCQPSNVVEISIRPNGMELKGVSGNIPIGEGHGSSVVSSRIM